jgi:hypothetical protein
MILEETQVRRYILVNSLCHLRFQGYIYSHWISQDGNSMKSSSLREDILSLTKAYYFYELEFATT